jgi:hypothetical protein
MTEFERGELKEIVLDSYSLLITLPFPKDNKGKWEVSSRNKLKSLPEALREFDDPTASVTHFVKSASYSLPRAERGSRGDSGLGKLLSCLLDTVGKYSQRDKGNPEHLRHKLIYLIGYLNWGADSICVLLTESHGDDRELQRRLQSMLAAEFTIIGAESEVEKITESVFRWSTGTPIQRGR